MCYSDLGGFCGDLWTKVHGWTIQTYKNRTIKLTLQNSSLNVDIVPVITMKQAIHINSNHTIMLDDKLVFEINRQLELKTKFC